MGLVTIVGRNRESPVSGDLDDPVAAPKPLFGSFMNDAG
jgi:hypothetical protein